MFTLKQSPSLRFKVAGFLTNEAGEPEPFQFSVDAPRLSTSDDVRALDGAVQEAEKRGSLTPITDVLVERFTGWAGPMDENGVPVPFGADACRQLLNLTGMASLVYAKYIASCSAQAR
jgi:hypothetical protein